MAGRSEQEETAEVVAEIVRGSILAVPKGQTEAANAFGGLIYIETPHTLTMPAFTATIDGAVAAPYYVHGETYVDELAVLHDVAKDQDYAYELDRMYCVIGLVSADVATVTPATVVR